eukprot:gene11011-12832_t
MKLRIKLQQKDRDTGVDINVEKSDTFTMDKSRPDKPKTGSKKKQLSESDRQRLRMPNPDFVFGLTAEFKTVPFYYRSQRLVDEMRKDRYVASLATQVTVDRLDRIVLMADKWQAPVSAAVFIRAESELEILTQMINSYQSLADFVDFHLLYANHTRYPVNNLRNLSTKNAHTEFVLIMDADFIPPLGMHDYLRDYIEEVQASGKKTAFVVPSFSSSADPRILPDDKPTLIDMIEKKLVSPSNLLVCPKCHSPTDYPKWFESEVAYPAKYRWIYEPFLLFNKTNNEMFDDRLKGYGFDKNSHVFSMAVAGYDFVVLPHAFIIHINHPTSSWEGPSLNEQQWDALRIVCELIPDVKKKYGYDINTK